MKTLGRHLVAELYGCDHARLDDVVLVERLVREACAEVGATVLQVVAHRYAPQGVTATAVIAESHLSVHTWPEHGYAAADVFTCGDLDPRLAFVHLRDGLAASQTRMRVVLRGLDAHLPPGEDVVPEDVLVLARVAAIEG